MFIWLNRHRKLAAIALALVACFALPAAAQAAHAPAGRTLLHAPAFVTAPPPLPCPAGTPTEAITLVNQASIPPIEILRLENALVAQSLQLRAAWGTPCVQFGPSGWPLTLLTGTDASVPLIGGCACGGFHAFSEQPYAEVSTDGSGLPPWDQPYQSLWEVGTSHELMEMLVDPKPSAHPQEVCDPVAWQSYTYGNGQAKVALSDFVTPAWFTGGPGPYDAMGLLASPYESDVQTWGSAT